METILNVFPLSHAPENYNNTSSTNSLYWFSQTIGPGRGLETIIKVIAIMRCKVDLYLRGSFESSFQYIQKLKLIAKEYGVADRLHFLNSAPPSDMVELASKYDVGLSIEPGINKNNNICLGNKIFTYLLAGIPVVLSDTDSQTEFSKTLGPAGILINLNDHKNTAHKLDSLFEDPIKLLELKNYARNIALTKYNWDIEKKKFIKLISAIV